MSSRSASKNTKSTPTLGSVTKQEKTGSQGDSSKQSKKSSLPHTRPKAKAHVAAGDGKKHPTEGVNISQQGELSPVKPSVTMTTCNTQMDSAVIAMSQLKLTKPAPEFSGTAVVNGEFKSISLSDYKGKYVVFFFYPLDFTFVCPTEIIAFSDRVEEFRAINCEVVACSTDSQFSHLAWVNTPRKQGGLGEMKIPLLADKTLANAQAYGVLKEDEGVAFRGLFIIDAKGNLRQITVNDLPVGRSVDETLRLVQAFQFTDKHGEVCPAGWRPGKETMKADPKESKKYFQKNA